jgi:hypothetical protein
MKSTTEKRGNFFRRAIAGGVVTGATKSALSAHMALAHGERRGHEGEDGRSMYFVSTTYDLGSHWSGFVVEPAPLT